MLTWFNKINFFAKENINHFDDPFPHVIIKNFFDKKILKKILLTTPKKKVKALI